MVTWRRRQRGRGQGCATVRRSPRKVGTGRGDWIRTSDPLRPSQSATNEGASRDLRLNPVAVGHVISEDRWSVTSLACALSIWSRADRRHHSLHERRAVLRPIEHSFKGALPAAPRGRKADSVTAPFLERELPHAVSFSRAREGYPCRHRLLQERESPRLLWSDRDPSVPKLQRQCSADHVGHEPVARL